MDKLIAYAMSMVGTTPYRYKGNNPLSGFDCSGFVCEVIRSAGLLKWNEDLNSQGLYDKFEKQAGTRINSVAAGSLAFYGESWSKITHVAFHIDPERVIECGGGDHLTLTREDAESKNAFVRIRVVRYRQDYLGSLRPDYSSIRVQ